MEYTYFFEERSPLFRLKAYAHEQLYKWECGGSFASDWAEKRWYEGILVFSKEGTTWYFFFKTCEVRDELLPPFNLETLFGDFTNMEILNQCEKKAQTPKCSPFPFVQITRGFMEDVVTEMPNAEIRNPTKGLNLI